jgi:hypothetical protein
MRKKREINKEVYLELNVQDFEEIAWQGRM